MFDSCSAYQKTSRSILFLSHCVPNPPDKGEKIRAHHILNHLARNHQVHLVCFARSEQDVADAAKLQDRCTSVYAERLQQIPALAKAALRFAAGHCLTTSFYSSSRLRNRAESLAGQVGCTVAFSSAMVQYAPERIPLIVDMVDVDSEKFADYSRRRPPRFLFGMESNRLRAVEQAVSLRSSAVLLTTSGERQLLRRFVTGGNIRVMENGIDLEYFRPNVDAPPDGLAGRDYAVFTGAMDYQPNSEAVTWFARQVVPEIRRSRPGFEFFIVGRSPSPAVLALANCPGVLVTGAVPDVRPYFTHARVAVAPLFLARGIQNKVLEALAMGKRVLASPAVLKTFGRNPPLGLCCCSSPPDYVQQVSRCSKLSESSIRADVAKRFRWSEKLNVIDEELMRVFHMPMAASQ